MKLYFFILFLFISSSVSLKDGYLSPTAMKYLESENLLIIAQKTANRIDLVNTKSFKKKTSIKLKHSPTGLCISNDMKLIFITAGEEEGMLYIIDLTSKKIKSVIKIGHSPCSPVLVSNDILVFCNRFPNQVSFFDLQANKIIKTISVVREPISIDFDEKHKQLIVANHLPDDASNSDFVSSEISFIDAEKMNLIKHVSMPAGSSSLKQIRVAPGGKYAVVSHILARYTVHPSQLEQGWQNTNAITLIDLEEQNIYHTVLLDDVKHGAANPWGVEFDEDGKTLFVTHAGTDELSIIDFQKLLEILGKYPGTPGHYSQLNDPSNKLSFIRECRVRFDLKGEGPRSLAVSSTTLFVGQYFSDAFEVVDYRSSRNTSQFFPLNNIEPDLARKGEMLFHSAKMCFENWQSCSSCHPDGRVDGFNWDLQNDGLGNPKNCKSMLLAHETPPAMLTGIRTTAEAAVRAGFTHTQFVQIEEKHATAVDKYLKSLRAVPSPYLIVGELNHKAKRGKTIFENEGCGVCHSGTWFTDLNKYEIGIQGEFDYQNTWDTPTLIEVWRTGPYLHDGRCATMSDVFSKENHGLKNMLSNKDVEQLVEYVMSL